MNKQILCIFALLLVSASATSMLEKYAFAFKSRRSIMGVMAQIESTIKAGGPMDAITRILDEFDAEIRAEQQAHQELHDRQNVECEDELSFRRHEINEASEAVHEAANTLESCQGQKRRAETDQKSADNQLSNARMTLGQLNRKKIEWDYGFETIKTALGMTLDSFGECYRLLDELDSGSSSFLQLTNHVTKMVPHVAKTRSMNHMNAVLSALAQITVSGANNKVAIEKVRTVLIQFEAQLKQKLADLLTENDQFQTYFIESERKYKNEITRLVQLLEDLANEIRQLSNCISVQQANLHSASEKLRRNTSLLNKAEAMCNSMREQFVKSTEARRDELELLTAIKIKVHERYAQISRGTTERGNMSADQLAEYDQLDYNHQTFNGI